MKVSEDMGGDVGLASRGQSVRAVACSAGNGETRPRRAAGP
jgi:hypothetical protein